MKTITILLMVAALPVWAQGVSVTLNPSAFARATRWHKLAYVLEGAAFTASAVDAGETMWAVRNVPGIHENNPLLLKRWPDGTQSLSAVKLIGFKAALGLIPVAATYAAHRLHPDDVHADILAVTGGALVTAWFVRQDILNVQTIHRQEAINAGR